jgi:hypothetical protein
MEREGAKTKRERMIETESVERKREIKITDKET